MSNRQFIVEAKKQEVSFATAINFSRFKPRMENAIRYVILGDFTPAEAAKIVGVSRQAVHQALKRFQKTCKKLLKEE